jgi:hypothetical protein
MGGFIEVARALLALAVGAAVGYFWQMTRPEDDFIIVAGVTLVSIVVLYFLLKSIGKGS